MRRWLSLWLQEWPLERAALSAVRQGRALPLDEPLVLLRPERGVTRVVAATPAARALGIGPGLALTDARAIHPALAVRDAEPEADAAALASLALWCSRWSPRIGIDGTDGITVDITGCAHLHGGEPGLLHAVTTAFARLGLTLRTGLAGRLLAARAWARWGAGGILPESEAREALDVLPVAALGIAPELVRALQRIGLERIGQLRRLPRATLLTRFGESLAPRLDELEGAAEPRFTPLTEPRRLTARLALAEPIGRTADIAAVIRRLLADLATVLGRAQLGASRLRLGLHRVDAAVATIEIGTSRPTRDPAHLFRLLAPRLDGLDIGFGIELMLAEVTESAALGPEQTGLAGPAPEAELACLVDRLQSRLGRGAVRRPSPRASHVPERTVAWIDAASALDPAPVSGAAIGSWLPPGPLAPRPLRLWPTPRPAQASAEVPDGPPLRLGDGSRLLAVRAAIGPERIEPEWWRPELLLHPPETLRPRDYWRLLDEEGRILWAFREGRYGDPRPPRWWLHGRFA